MVDLLNSMQGCNIVPILLYLDIQAILNRLAKKSFSNDASFRTAVHQEIASQEIGREVLILFSVHLQPSELQQRLIDSLPQEMDSKVQVLVSIHLQDVSRTFTFILHMEEQYIQMILNVRGRQREVHIGKLLRVLANCDNYKGIPVIVDIIFSYNSSVVSDLLYNEQIIARIINYLFKLPRNGYRETVELLNYHKNSEIGQLKAFFEHYYHNQWIDHVHFDDETVLSVVLRPKSSDIEYVTGNEYNRKGRLLYTGCYLGCQYNGHGKLYLDDQSYYEGTFDGGKRSGVFYLRTERYTLRKDNFVRDKRNGECVEYFDNSEMERSVATYVDDKRCGPAREMDGTGGLQFKGCYNNNLREGEGFEFLGPHLCKKGKYMNGILTSWSWHYLATPYMPLDMQNYDYHSDPSYYTCNPIPLIQKGYGQDYITPFSSRGRAFLCII